MPARADNTEPPKQEANEGDASARNGQATASGARRVYDLGERTARFCEAIVRFARTIPITPVTRSMVTQLVNAATSVGANYCEADEGVSRKDFRNRIGTCKKEAKETKYWLRMIAAAGPQTKQQARSLWQEAKELHLIFAQIFRSAGEKRSGKDTGR